MSREHISKRRRVYNSNLTIKARLPLDSLHRSLSLSLSLSLSFSRSLSFFFFFLRVSEGPTIRPSRNPRMTCPPLLPPLPTPPPSTGLVRHGLAYGFLLRIQSDARVVF